MNKFLGFAKHLPAEPTSILEVGVGALDTCRSRPWWDRGVQCMLFEPLPKYYNKLQQAAKGYENVKIHQCAIWHDDCGVELRQMNSCSFVDAITPRPFAKRQLKRRKFTLARVPSARLDQYDKGKFDVALIDVEGSEWVVLQQMVSRPRFIALELWAKQPGWKHPSLDDIQDWLAKNGYHEIVREERDSYFIRDGK